MSGAAHPARGPGDRLTGVFWRRPKLLTLLLLLPPLLWLGVVYIGSLVALLIQSFYSIDQFSGLVVPEFTLKTYGELLVPSNADIILRTVTMAATVTLASVVVAFPVAYFAARHARGRWKAVFYLGIMLPLWSSYLVKVYAWKLILAKEGILNWAVDGIGASAVLNAILALPVIGGNSLSVSYIGTFLVFLYVWLPFMILPLAMPGMIAGSIFTFSLTLGDYIIPQIVGSSRRFIGQAVYQHQGTAGNIPLAAAFAVVPILIMVVYLWAAKRKGAFDAL